MPSMPENVLIVDDDRTMLDIQEAAFLSAGDIHVRVCEDYDSAVQAMQENVPDIVMLDLRMPGKDGTDILHDMRLQASCKDVPVVFVTGETRVEMQDMLEKLGVIGVIHKPFSPMNYLNEVQRIWQKHFYSVNEENNAKDVEQDSASDSVA